MFQRCKAKTASFLLATLLAWSLIYQNSCAEFSKGIRLHIAGVRGTEEYKRFCNMVNALHEIYGDGISMTQEEFSDEAEFEQWLPAQTATLGPAARTHPASKPLVWASASAEDDIMKKEEGRGHEEESNEAPAAAAAAAAAAREHVADLPAFLRARVLGGGGGGGPRAYRPPPRHPFPARVGHAYDLVVVGGGSGGLACAKAAAGLGAAVACLDYVKPSPQGTTWGLGGTCVNVGCIPKKLMHQAALLGAALQDASFFGWEFEEAGGAPPEEGTGSSRLAGPGGGGGGGGGLADVLRGAGLGGAAATVAAAAAGEAGGGGGGRSSPAAHSWEAMVRSVQGHIRRLNRKSREGLEDAGVDYFNALGRFTGPNALELTRADGSRETITADRFVIAVGGRPNRLGCPGGQHALTSDDLFSLPAHPGRTLVVGASYVALECAGFLRGIGAEATVMVRSILLRGFDQEMAAKIGNYMEKEGVRFIRESVPEKIEKLENGKLKVTWFTKEGFIQAEEFDTVLAATGRYADVGGLGLENAGAPARGKGGKLVCRDEQTSVPHIFAVGDVVEGVPELTPAAIQAGRLLARRLFRGTGEAMDYEGVATAVFTPLEYGCCGLAEEEAVDRYGEENIEVYHGNFHPLEWEIVPHREENQCFTKVICLKSEDERVVGFHYLGPAAGEVAQGFALALRRGATYADLAATTGIHPTCAEAIVGLKITKRSGEALGGGNC